MAFQMIADVRRKIPLDPALFSPDGKIRFKTILDTRRVAGQISDLQTQNKISAATLNAIDLLDQIFRELVHAYQVEKVPRMAALLLDQLENWFKAEEINSLLEATVTGYPPEKVFTNAQSPAQYLAARTDGQLNREWLLEDLILIWISTQNPAKKPYNWLLHDPALVDHPNLKPILSAIEVLFESLPTFGPEGQSLVQMLKSPALHSPNSLFGQLEFIQTHWSQFLGEYLGLLLKSLDLAREEEKIASHGPGPVLIPRYDREEFFASGGREQDIEAFSRDSDWMPRLVLIAKNVFVWMDQLSRKFGRPIQHLDQIPDEELAALAARGISGLWLIGLWQRSPASARIKQLCGNPEAIASAYSLYSYQIAEELGGEPACESLKRKAARYGVRLASDMVPNHMGIDSEWVLDHPERFLSLDHCPYPAYQFTGPDLSNRPGVTLQIEDRYYDRADAAVVFRRIDHRDGSHKFIYHGNDGTSMPWNDTAQLNYLDANVREVVIQTILEVARRFSIIRFDAAMTLAKKHIQRLWFPQPGSGGAIPSRSEYAVSQVDFDRALPNEFWREVVERVEKEVPDTLLLAEAFWLMEGYFVRSLGMHRVYNSAFMHMLRDEDNAGYRKIIKNTLEFEPEILKRFVNFMNNPDERTAIDQFGNGDKYFGVCTLLATLPGLPMIGHGQFEGFTEKYGMEYRKAYLNETEDRSLISRHEFEICPLLHQRELYAGVENFRFFDYKSDHGVDENVFAFTNSNNGKHALVIVNNQYQSTYGAIKRSSPQQTRQAGQKQLSSMSVIDSLGFGGAADGFLVFKDQSTGLHFLRPVRELGNRGFEIHLNGYEHHVFLDFQWVHNDETHDYDALYSQIGNYGIPNLEAGLRGLRLQPILQPLRELLKKDLLDDGRNCLKVLSTKPKKQFLQKISDILEIFYKECQTSTPQGDTAFSGSHKQTLLEIEALLDLTHLEQTITIPGAAKLQKVVARCDFSWSANDLIFATLFTWLAVHPVYTWISESSHIELADALHNEIRDSLRSAGYSATEIQTTIQRIHMLNVINGWFAFNVEPDPQKLLRAWFSTDAVRSYTKMNEFENVTWYDGDRFAELLWWLKMVAVLNLRSIAPNDQTRLVETLLMCDRFTRKLAVISRSANFQVSKLTGLVR